MTGDGPMEYPDRWAPWIVNVDMNVKCFVTI